MSKMSVTLEVTNDNFAAIAVASGYVPRAQVEGYARHMAGEVLKQHNIVPPWETGEQAVPPNPIAQPLADPVADPEKPSPAVKNASEEPVDEQMPEAAPPVAPKRRGRPKKEEAPVLEAVAKVTQTTNPPTETPAPGSFAEAVENLDPKAAVSEETDQPAAPLTVEDVRSALRDIAARIDFAACRPLLDHFGAKKASEVPVEKIADFVAASKLGVGDEDMTVAKFEAALKAAS